LIRVHVLHYAATLRKLPWQELETLSNPKPVTGNFIRKNRRTSSPCLLFCFDLLTMLVV